MIFSVQQDFNNTEILFTYWEPIIQVFENQFYICITFGFETRSSEELGKGINFFKYEILSTVKEKMKCRLTS